MDVVLVLTIGRLSGSQVIQRRFNDWNFPLTGAIYLGTGEPDAGGEPVKIIVQCTDTHEDPASVFTDITTGTVYLVLLQERALVSHLEWFLANGWTANPVPEWVMGN